MSHPNKHVFDILDQLNIIKKYDFSELDRFRKAELLVGDGRTIDLIHLYFSKEGKEMINNINEANKKNEFIDHIILNINSGKTFAEVFMNSYKEIL